MAPTPPASADFDPAQLLAHRDFVRALARRLVFGDEAADELAQQTIATAWAARPEPRAGLRGWLAKVALRLRDRGRRDDERRTRRERDAANPEAQPSAAELAAQIELEQRLAHAVSQLHEPYRSTLFLRYWHDLAPTAIAERDQVPVATVKSRLQRALGQLREEMDAAHGGRREAWAGGLIGLTQLGAQAGVVAMAGSTKVVISTAAALVVALVGWRVVIEAASPPNDPIAPAVASDLTEKPEDAAARTNPARDEARVVGAERSLAPLGELPFASALVVDPEGQPLAGVLVVPLLLDRRDRNNFLAQPFLFDEAAESAITHSDAAGEISVVEMPPDAATLALVKEGHEVVEWTLFSRDRGENQQRRFVLPRARDLPGRVHDSEGRPIEGALLFWRMNDDDDLEEKLVASHLDDQPEFTPTRSRLRRYAISTADGDFVLHSLAPGQGLLRVTADGYETRPLVDDGAISSVAAELRRDSVLFDVRDAVDAAQLDDAAGVVFDAESGKLLDRFHPLDVTRYQPHQRRMKVAGRLALHLGVRSPGSRSVSWLPIPGTARRVVVRIDAPGRIACDFTLVLDGGREPPLLVAALARGDDLPTLAGHIEGASAARVEARPLIVDGKGNARMIDVMREPPLAVATSDGNGRFAFGALPAGRWRLDGGARGVAPITVEVDVPRDDLVLVFPAAGAMLCVVRDRTGQALAGVDVQAELVDGTRAWNGTTADDGTLAIESLPPGDYFVGAFPDGLRYVIFDDDRRPRPFGRDHYLADERVTLAAGERRHCELALPEATEVLFRVVDQSGVPIAGARLQIEPRDGLTGRIDEELRRNDESLVPRCDAAGEARVELFAGSHWVFASADGVTSQRVVAILAAAEATVTMVVPRHGDFGVLEGQVVDLVSGAPIADRRVAATIVLADGGAVDVASSTSDENGRFRFERVPAATIRVIAWGNVGSSGKVDRAAPWLTSTLTIDVAAGVTTTVVVPLARTEANDDAKIRHQLIVTVRDADSGAALPGATIDIGGVIGSASLNLGNATSGSDGIATATVPTCERYTLRIKSPRGPRGESDPTHEDVRLEVDPKAGDLALDVHLKPLQ
jgi:RNA polymerase sigma-70 factor (ECF subfamily)